MIGTKIIRMITMSQESTMLESQETQIFLNSAHENNLQCEVNLYQFGINTVNKSQFDG